MRLADDRRGRVPFALIGVLLLVASASLAAVGPPSAERTSERPAVDRALSAAAAAMQTALRRAALSAGRAAAREPLLVAANTTYGRVLDGPTPTARFERALRTRVYLAALERFDALSVDVDGVTATVELPGIENASDLRAALNRTRVARAHNGTALRVRLTGVRLVVRRDGRVVGSRRVSPTVTVASPVLALHDRVRSFERRLNAGPLRPGLGRQLTARLYAMAWARGYAQFGGAPILNVLANRHVELATNAAALATARAAFGRSDPDGRRAHRWAAARVGVTDLALGLGAERRWVDAVLRTAAKADAPAPGLRPAAGIGSGTRAGPSDERRFDASRAADTALAALTERGVAAVANRTYRVEARVIHRLGITHESTTGERRPPGNWTLVDVSRIERVSVRNSSVGMKGVPEEWYPFARYERRVIRNRTTVRTWRRGDRTRRTVRTVREVTPVAIAVVGRHSPNVSAPRSRVSGVYHPGGPLQGPTPNLAGVPDRAIERLVTDLGGPAALARRIVTGRYRPEIVTIQGRQPPGLRGYLLEGLVALDRRVRNLSVSLERGAVGSFETNPARRLLRRLRDRRAALLDAPSTYPGIAAKARTAVRAAYLDRVRAALERRAAAFDRRRRGVDGALGDVGVSLDRVAGAMGAAGAAPPERPAPVAGLAGRIPLRVDTAPAYLTLGRVARQNLAVRGEGSTTPLAARNVNVFTLPYGDAVDEAFGALFGGGRVDLATAAQTLRASAPPAGDDDDIAARRAALRDAVERSVGHVRAALRRTLVDRGVAPETARRAVATGLARWNGTAARALALVNGSAAGAVAVATPEPPPGLAAALRVAARDALADDAARVPQRFVEDTERAARSVVRTAVADRAAEAGQRARDRLQKRLGWGGRFMSGLPVAPPGTPWPWQFTLNVWHVTVRGAYERVTVRAGGSPRSTVYSRDRSAVRLDVDDDGTPDRLGRTTRVRFDVSTVVLVVVPPGPPGVGDVGGQAVEESPGWDDAG